MRIQTRRFLNNSFTCTGFFALALMAFAVLIILGPMIWRGSGAVFFWATSEHRRLLFEQFNIGSGEAVSAERMARQEALAPVYGAFKAFDAAVRERSPAERRALRKEAAELKEAVAKVVGPFPGDPEPALIRSQYGQTRLDRAREELRHVFTKAQWVYPVDAQGNPQPGVLRESPRREVFAGTPLEAVFDCLATHEREILRPKFTVYYQFFTLPSLDAHFFGGIMPELLGTLYLAIGAMIFAVPVGVTSAIYLTEYTRQGRLVEMIRACINTLAGVPSIVFGLFGLTFFIVTLKITPGKSISAGALTLGLLVLPTIIRAAEEAIRSVPPTYKEAALSLGAGKWRTICTVVLPAALPGILTGIVISMGRAAGETAPVIFTAAVSMGGAVGIRNLLTSPTPTLSWNIYNLVSEHEAADEIRHVQYGMAATLVALVLLLNLIAIVLRARIARRLKG